MMTTADPIAERAFRGAGCGQGCRVVSALLVGVFGRSDLLLHDPSAHEAYGRHQAGGDDGPLVRTGLLTVDVDGVSVLVDARPVYPTPTEMRLLLALAGRVGRMVPHAELTIAVWGLGAVAVPAPTYQHCLRVNMARLRRRLYPLGGLISTVPMFGYRLESLPAGANARFEPATGRRPSERWSRHADACRACGLDDLPHQGVGYCASCYEHRAVRPGRGRTAAVNGRRIAAHAADARKEEA